MSHCALNCVALEAGGLATMITCFWCDSSMAMMAVLTKGDDGHKGDVQRHRQAACKTRSARPTETCVPLLMQVQEVSLGEF
jgi:hypothetical protein